MPEAKHDHQKAVEYHESAAKHHQDAAYHHKEAAKHYSAGDHEKAAYQAAAEAFGKTRLGSAKRVLAEPSDQY